MTETRPAAVPDDPPAPGRRRRWPIAVLLLAAATGLVGALLVGGDGDERPSTTTIALPTPQGPALDAGGSELVRLLEAGRTRTFHATYRASGDAVEDAGQLTIELWRSDGRQRQDTVLELANGDVARTAGLVLGDRTVVCSQRPKQDWTCSEAVNRDVDPDGVFGSARDQLKGVAVRSRADTVAGRAVRCFDFTAADGQGTFCVTPEGVPVRVAVGGSEFVLSALSDDVENDAFDPPARPGGATDRD